MASAKEAAAVEAQDTEITNEVIDAAAQLGVRRYFTIPGRAPFDEVEWEIRDATIPGKNGPAFEQKDVEFPKFWSQTATNIVAQKYFRGRLSSPDRERSVKQMIGRVVDTIGGCRTRTTRRGATRSARARPRSGSAGTRSCPTAASGPWT